MYTVVIIDDEPWALQGLAEIIDWSRDGFSIIGQFTDPDEAFEFLREKEPDVVFTDIRMPGLSGLDLIEMSKREGLNCEFVLISSYELGGFDVDTDWFAENLEEVFSSGECVLYAVG